MIFRKKKPEAQQGILSLLLINLQNFVGLSETIDPEQVWRFISRYYELCTAVVTEYGGHIAMTKADRVLAAWSDDDGCKRCCECALQLINVLPRENYMDLGIDTKTLSYFLSISHGNCIYVKENAKIVEVIGGLATEVERINGAEYHPPDTIIVGAEVKFACPDFKYRPATDMEQVYILDGLQASTPYPAGVH